MFKFKRLPAILVAAFALFCAPCTTKCEILWAGVHFFTRAVGGKHTTTNIAQKHRASNGLGGGSYEAWQWAASPGIDNK